MGNTGFINLKQKKLPRSLQEEEIAKEERHKKRRIYSFVRILGKKFLSHSPGNKSIISLTTSPLTSMTTRK